VSQHEEFPGITFGGGLVWYDERRFMREMRVGRPVFRRLCRALKCPMIEVSDTRFVNLQMFRLAMWTISRIGQKNFLVPGCRSLYANQRSKYPDSYTTELDLSHFVDNMDQILKEVVAARKMDGFKVQKQTIDLYREAAERILKANARLGPHTRRVPRASEIEDAEEEAEGVQGEPEGDREAAGRLNGAGGEDPGRRRKEGKSRREAKESTAQAG
jgi:hypothetical protein